MILQILAILLFFITLIFIKFYYLPKKKLYQFAQQAQKKGYNVKIIPFKFMQYYMLQFEQMQEGNLNIFKNQMTNYDLVVSNMFDKLAIIPINIQLLKDFYNQLDKLPKNPFITQVYTKYLNGGGLVFTQGQTWKRKRRIISSVFHYDFLNEMIPIIEEQIRYYCLQIDNNIKDNKTINLQVLMVKILSSIIAKCFFGTDMRNQLIQSIPYSEYVVKYLQQVNAFAISPQHAFLGMLGPRYGITQKCRQINKKLRIIFEISKEVILKQLDKIKSNKVTCKNLLTVFYESGLLSIGSKQNTEQYSIEQLIGQFITFVGAGTDSSSHALNLMFHYLSQNQNYVKNIRQDNQIVSKQTEINPVQKVKKLLWAQAVFNQTLRINGPISQIIPRLSNQSLKLGQLQVPKDTAFNVLPLINHYQSKFFQKPAQFLPQRWINGTKIQPYSFMPFAGGQRNCIGKHLAKLEGKLIISKLIQKYEINSVHQIRMKKKFFFITEYSQFKIRNRVS